MNYIVSLNEHLCFNIINFSIIIIDCQLLFIKLIFNTKLESKGSLIKKNERNLSIPPCISSVFLFAIIYLITIYLSVILSFRFITFWLVSSIQNFYLNLYFAFRLSKNS